MDVSQRCFSMWDPWAQWCEPSASPVEGSCNVAQIFASARDASTVRIRFMGRCERTRHGRVVEWGCVSMSRLSAFDGHTPRRGAQRSLFSVKSLHAWAQLPFAKLGCRLQRLLVVWLLSCASWASSFAGCFDIGMIRPSAPRQMSSIAHESIARTSPFARKHCENFAKAIEIVTAPSTILRPNQGSSRLSRQPTRGDSSSGGQRFLNRRVLLRWCLLMLVRTCGLDEGRS